MWRGETDICREVMASLRSLDSHSLAEIPGGEHRAQSASPEPYRSLADLAPALIEHVIYIPKRQRKPDVAFRSQANELRARLEASTGAEGWGTRNATGYKNRSRATFD